MAWVAPTVPQFKIRFPAFASVADATVQAVLDEAVGQVGETWIEASRTPAVLQLTAHLLASQGLGLGAGGSGAAIVGTIKRRKVGDVETEFAGTGTIGSGALGMYGSTAYGREYLRLMRMNFPAVAVV